MDLIYANAQMEDQGVFLNPILDLAFGDDENNFEMTVSTANHCCESGFIIYCEGTEYGGVIDRIRVETENKLVVYGGRTWHGILESKVIEPDSGEDYFIVSGEANQVLQTLIERLGLDDLFEASSEDSGINISSYQFNRYVKGYTGIRKMLKTVGGKLHFVFEEGQMVISALPIVDYSQDDEFDSDQIKFVIEKNYRPVNHLICLGRGELAEREVIHLYVELFPQFRHSLDWMKSQTPMTMQMWNPWKNWTNLEGKPWKKQCRMESWNFNWMHPKNMTLMTLLVQGNWSQESQCQNLLSKRL